MPQRFGRRITVRYPVKRELYKEVKVKNADSSGTEFNPVDRLL